MLLAMPFQLQKETNGKQEHVTTELGPEPKGKTHIQLKLINEGFFKKKNLSQ